MTMLKNFLSRKPVNGGGDKYVNVESEPVEESAQALPVIRKKKSLTRFGSRARREEQMAALQAGYQELVGLMSSIETHLDHGAKSQKKLLTYMEGLPEAVVALEHVGKSSEQQTEVLGLIRRQLETNVEHDQHIVQSMNQFNDTLGVMDQTNRTAAETITGLVDRSRESEDMLRMLFQRSERRLVLLGVTMMLVILGVSGAAFYLVKSSGVFEKRAVELKASTAVTSKLIPRKEVVELAPKLPEIAPSLETIPAESAPTPEEKKFLGLF